MIGKTSAVKRNMFKITFAVHTGTISKTHSPRVLLKTIPDYSGNMSKSVERTTLESLIFERVKTSTVAAKTRLNSSTNNLNLYLLRMMVASPLYQEIQPHR